MLQSVLKEAFLRGPPWSKRLVRSWRLSGLCSHAQPRPTESLAFAQSSESESERSKSGGERSAEAQVRQTHTLTDANGNTCCAQTIICS